MHIVFVDALEWESAEELADLLYGVMYRDFGVAREGEWREHEEGSVTAVALDDDGVLIGTARLLPETEPGAARQVRQLAVDPKRRGSGVASALMAAIEYRAAQEGAREIFLHARNTAIDFYERLGYSTADGDPFVSELTGIPHRTMRKSLI
jgi:N-acetylglutamate synthase-like GNAT family acetyltransferase